MLFRSLEAVEKAEAELERAKAINDKGKMEEAGATLERIKAEQDKEELAERLAEEEIGTPVSRTSSSGSLNLSKSQSLFVSPTSKNNNNRHRFENVLNQLTRRNGRPVLRPLQIGTEAERIAEEARAAEAEARRLEEEARVAKASAEEAEARRLEEQAKRVGEEAVALRARAAEAEARRLEEEAGVADPPRVDPSTLVVTEGSEKEAEGNVVTVVKNNQPPQQPLLPINPRTRIPILPPGQANKNMHRLENIGRRLENSKLNSNGLKQLTRKNSRPVLAPLKRTVSSNDANSLVLSPNSLGYISPVTPNIVKKTLKCNFNGKIKTFRNHLVRLT